MVLLTTRAGKGSPLTNTEMDANLTSLNAGFDQLCDAAERATAFDSAASLNQTMTTLRKGTVAIAAASSGQQYFRLGLLQSTSLTDVATVTRATAATAQDQSATVNTFASGQPAITTAGLSSFEASTNVIRNSNATTGSVVGTPGTLPTNWVVQFNPAALSTQVVATGVEDGLNYVDLRIFGTAAGTNFNFGFDGPTALAASNGQTWTQSLFLRMVGGSTANVTGMTLAVIEDTSGGAFVHGVNSADLRATLSAVSIGRNRPSVTSTLTGGGTVAAVQPQLQLVVTNGAAIDLTLRLAAPQIEQKAFPTPYILTTGAAATRNADVIREIVNIPVGQPFTIVGKYIAPSGQPASVDVCDLGDSLTPNNRVRVRCNSPGNALRVDVYSAGVATAGLFTTAVTSGAPVGFACAVNGNQLTWSVNGAAAQTATIPSGAFNAAMVAFALGCDLDSTAQLNSTIRDLRVIGRALSGAECATFSDVSLEWDIDFTTQTYKYLGSQFTAGITDLPLTTFARSGARGAFTAGGTFMNYNTGVPRINDAGLTMDPATTNVLNQADMSTAVVGPLASTGALPSYNSGGVRNWSTAGSLNGLVASVSAVGVENGMDYFELTVTGTPSATSGYGYYFDQTSNAAAAASGQTWTASARVKVVSLTGASLVLNVHGRDAAGAGIESGAGANITAGAVTPTLFSNTLTLANASTARVTGSLQIGYTNGVAVNAVFRVYQPQVEQKAYPTGFVKSAGSAATASVDTLTTIDSNPASFVILAEFTIPATGALFRWVYGWDDGTGNNRVALYYDVALGKLFLLITTGGVQQAALDLGVTAAGTGAVFKVAIRVAPNDVAASKNGGTAVTTASTTVPSVSNFRYGQGIPGNGNENGAAVRKIKRWRGISAAANNAALQALAA